MAYTGGSQALQFFFTILSGAYNRATTEQIWADLRAASEATGIPLTGISITDVSQLRSYAGTIVRAAETLASSPESFAMDASMIGTWPTSSTGPGTGLSQAYLARFGYETTDIYGNTETNYVSAFFAELPDTVGDLLAALQGEAMGFAEAYNTTGAPVTVTDLSQVQLTTV